MFLLGTYGVIDVLLEVVLVGIPTLFVCYSMMRRGPAISELGKATFVLNAAADTGSSHPILLGHDLAGNMTARLTAFSPGGEISPPARPC